MTPSLGSGDDPEVPSSTTKIAVGGFSTALAGPTPVAPRSPALEAGRDAARRGAEVERAVLLVDASRAGSADVCELVERDRDAGVRIHLVDAANALPELPVPLSFALSDAGTVQLRGETSNEPADVLRAGEAAAALRDAAPLDEVVLEEPLAASAPVARALAPVTCTGCDAYHGLVQDLRMLGVVASPQRNGGFYRLALSAAAERGDRRVLISGAADYSMLAHVLAAFDEVVAIPEVEVIDRCPTPLLLSRWYASSRSRAIHTRVIDAVDYEASAPFDVVITDSLLTLLSPQMRERIVARWRSALAPGGRVITSLRIAPEAAGGPERSTDQLLEEFVGWVLHEARRRADLVHLDLPALEAAARRYAQSVPTWPMHSLGELERLFDGAGMELEELELVELPGRRPAGGIGGGAHRDAAFARLIARRP